MKYKEFEKLMRDVGFDVIDGRYNIKLFNESLLVATISKERTKTLNTNCVDIMWLSEELRDYVAKRCVELAFTDLEDREDEEKYYYRLKGFQDSEYNAYLKYCTESLVIFISNDEREYYTYKSQFTETEFEALPDDIKAHNWEKIKVDREWSEMD